MHSNDIYKLSNKELVSDSVDREAYQALRGLYSKSSPEIRDEDIKNYHFVQAYMIHLNLRLTDNMRELEKIKNRTFMEKLKDLFSK
jgi:hypothetical protein